jgi:hypothetical protein
MALSCWIPLAVELWVLHGPLASLFTAVLDALQAPKPFERSRLRNHISSGDIDKALRAAGC